MSITSSICPTFGQNNPINDLNQNNFTHSDEKSEIASSLPEEPSLMVKAIGTSIFTVLGVSSASLLIGRPLNRITDLSLRSFSSLSNETISSFTDKSEHIISKLEKPALFVGKVFIDAVKAAAITVVALPIIIAGCALVCAVTFSSVDALDNAIGKGIDLTQRGWNYLRGINNPKQSVLPKTENTRRPYYTWKLAKVAMIASAAAFILKRPAHSLVEGSFRYFANYSPEDARKAAFPIYILTYRIGSPIDEILNRLSLNFFRAPFLARM